MKSAVQSWRVSPKLIIWSAVLWMALAMVPALAAADEGPSQQDGLIALRTANDAFEEEDFERAYEKYTEAYEILEVPMIKYRMGQAADELGKTEEAIAHYEAYRELGDDEEFLGRIDEALPRLRANLPATIDVTSEPEGAKVYLYAAESEELLGTTPVSLEVEGGKVSVAVRMEGYEEEVFRQEVEGGEKYEWAAALQEEGDAPVAQGIDLDVDAPDDESNLAAWGWTAAGVGVATLALGGVMSFMQASVTDEINSFSRAEEGQGRSEEELNSLRAELDTKRNDAQNYYRAAMGSYIAGGVLTAAGVGLMVFHGMQGGDADEGLSFQGAISPNGGFVGVSGRF